MKKIIAALLALGLAVPAAAQGLRTDEIGVSASSGDVAAATATATLPGIQNAVTKLCGFATVSMPTLGAGNTHAEITAWGMQSPF